jgi:hypothetical protein
MIVSYLHNFIFIKTKKTAGTTVEMTLAPACGPDDVITPLSPKEELLRGNGQPLCRNFAGDPASEERQRSLLMAARAHMRRQGVAMRRANRFYNHMRAGEMKPMLAPAFWDGAVKITTERHPYEKAVSFAYFTFKPEEMSFEEHLDSIVRRGGYEGHPYYTIGEEVVADEFIRYETLRDDLRRVGAKLGIPIPDELVHTKSRTRLDQRPAREILSDAQKEIVYATCRKEFELLGYDR